MLPDKQTNLVSNGKQQSIFAEASSKLFKGNKESNMFDRFSSLSSKEKILAVSVAGAIFASALPIVAVALPLAVPGAIVALTLFFAYKAVEYTFKGLKWSAEKTVDGAKYTAGKIKDGAVHAKDKIKGSTSHVVHNVSQSLDRLSSQTNYSDAMLNSQLLSGDAKGKIVSIKEQLMGIFNNEEIANKDKLLKKILKDIVLQIESKKNHAQGTDSEKYVPEWDKQINFIKNLDAEKLHDLLTKQSSPKSTYFLYTIFSEHHDKVERIVKQCKTEHKLSNSIENLNRIAEKHGKSRKGSTQSIENSLSKSNSLNSVRTDSTVSSEAELLNPAKHKEVKTTASLWDRVSSPFKSGKKSEKTTGMEDGDLDFVENPIYLSKQPRSNSLNSLNSDDSGMGSGSSTPKGQSLSIEEGLDEAMKELNLAVSQLPSSKVDEDSVHHPAGVQVKTN